MLIDCILLYDPWHVFNFFKEHLVKESLEYFALKANRSDLLQYISGWIFEINTVVIIKFLEYDLISQELFVDLHVFLI